MRGWTKLVVASGLVTLGCEADRMPLPTQPVATVVALPATACRASDATAIAAEITALYPNSPALRGAALAQFSSVKTQCTKNPADAQGKAVRLAGFAARKFQTHQLLPTATAAAVSSHMNHLFLYVGLPLPGDLTAALGGGGGAAAVGPADPALSVVTGDGKAGVSIPTGAISATQAVLVTVTPAVDQTDPLPTTLPQYGPFYDFHTYPFVTKFAHQVTIGICATVPQAVAGRIQLIRPDAANPTTAIEILARGPAAPFLACSALPLSSRGVERQGLLDRLLAAATAWLRPKELHARALQQDVTGAVTTSTDNTNTSPMGSTDPGSHLVFTTQPGTTGMGQPTTLVVAVQDGTGNTITSYTGDISVNIGTNPGGGTLASSVTQGSGVATFSVSIDRPGSGYTLDASASGFDPTPQPATSDAFDVAILFTQVSPRNDHSCGVTPSGDVYCWGSNNLGRLGTGTTTSSLTPVRVSSGETFARVSAGAEFTCAVTTGGAGWCWGRNSYGQLGNGSTTDDPTTLPVAVSGGHVFADISTGAEHACGLTLTGEAWCWGLNDDGELGNGTLINSSVPVAVGDGHVFATIGAGDFHNCGVEPLPSGAVWCWGNNLFGQLGTGTSGLGTDASLPEQVQASGLSFTTVSPGNLHTCGVATGGDAYCWGRNFFGELGDNTTTDASVPVKVSGGYTFAGVSAGRSAHTCGVTTSGDAYCWGHNNFGQLGNGSTSDTPIPVIVSGGYATISAGGPHTCAVTTGGAGFCWGFNFSGQLGDGTTNNSPSPVPVAP